MFYYPAFSSFATQRSKQTAPKVGVHIYNIELVVVDLDVGKQVDGPSYHYERRWFRCFWVDLAAREACSAPPHRRSTSPKSFLRSFQNRCYFPEYRRSKVKCQQPNVLLHFESRMTTTISCLFAPSFAASAAGDVTRMSALRKLRNGAKFKFTNVNFVPEIMKHFNYLIDNHLVLNSHLCNKSSFYILHIFQRCTLTRRRRY